MKLIICGETNHEMTEEHVSPRALRQAFAETPITPIFMASMRDAFLGELKNPTLANDGSFGFKLNLTPDGSRIMAKAQPTSFLYPEGIIHEKRGDVITRFELTAWSLMPRTGPQPENEQRGDDEPASL